jgi:aryl-alcohol dehydrogenase-like predicted oxidoreductase
MKRASLPLQRREFISLVGAARVTAVIPGTSNPAHMADNLGAMRGRLPDPEQRNRTVAFVDNL